MKKPNLFTRQRWRGDLAPSLFRQLVSYSDDYRGRLTPEHSAAMAYRRRANNGKGRVHSLTAGWVPYAQWRWGMA